MKQQPFSDLFKSLDANRKPIPQEIISAKRWLLFKLKPKSNGKSDKVPYYANGKPRSGKLDEPEDTANLVSWEHASQILDSNHNFDGLGFALGKDGDGYWQGIDLDNVSANKLDKLAESLPGYVELSPSGKGVHALGYGRGFSSRNDNGIEHYSGGRFFTFTGNGIRSGELCDLSDYIKKNITPDLSFEKRETRDYSLGKIILTDNEVAEVRKALFKISADCSYEQWIRIAFSLMRVPGGLDMWKEWSLSATDEQKRATDSELSRKAHRDLSDFRGEVGLGTLFHYAEEAGYVRGEEALKVQESERTQLERRHNTPARRIDLATLLERKIESHPFIIPDWLPANAVTLFAGHGGTGKSYVSLQIAISLACGIKTLGHELERAYSVVYLSGEDSEQTMLWRTRNYVQNKFLDINLVSDNLHIMDWSEKSTQVSYELHNGKVRPNANFEEIISTVQMYDADVLIIDNNSMFYGGNEIDRSQIQMYMSALRSVKPNIAVLTLHHIDKASQISGNTDAYSGSTAWNNAARSRWSIGMEDGSNYLSLRKSNYGKVGYYAKATFLDKAKYFELEDPVMRNISAGDCDKTLMRAIRDLLVNGEEEYYSIKPRTKAPNNLKIALVESKLLPDNINEASIWTAITKLVEKGYIDEEYFVNSHRNKVEKAVLTHEGIEFLNRDSVADDNVDDNGN